VLHYVANNRKLQQGDLLLIDAGAEFWGYASDVTRTYPVNGIYTSAQKVAYDIVRNTQLAVMQSVRPSVSWTTLNNVCRGNLTLQLMSFGFLTGDYNTLMNLRAYSYFLPHSVGHTIGLDVHDSQPATLAASMAITVEPGLYFNDALLATARNNTSLNGYINWNLVNQYLGSGGVRIEDDLIVTNTGSQLITLVPGDIAAIEAIMKL